jgi:hypothetical protein
MKNQNPKSWGRNAYLPLRTVAMGWYAWILPTGLGSNLAMAGEIATELEVGQP